MPPFHSKPSREEPRGGDNVSILTIRTKYGSEAASLVKLVMRPS
jgi:hypothetical protein